MNAVRRPLVAALAVLALLAACGDREAASPSSTESAVATDEPTETPPEPTDEPTGGASSAPSYSPLVAAAVADLAAVRGEDPAGIEVVAQEEVTWRDGSLGCAKKGVMYTQALVDGSRIVLRLDGETYEYHSGGGQKPFLCERPTQ